MSKFKITTRLALKVSRLIGKLDLKITDPKASADEVGADLILQIVGKIGDAEDEVAEIIATVAGVTKEEALDMDLVEFFESNKGDNGLISFFISAVRSKLKG